MGVLLGRAPVRGPPGVTNTHLAICRGGEKLIFKVPELSDRTAHLDLSVFVEDGDTRGVVALVLQSFQSIDQNRCRVFMPCVSDNSTHVKIPFQPLEPALLLLAGFLPLHPAFDIPLVGSTNGQRS